VCETKVIKVALARVRTHDLHFNIAVAIDIPTGVIPTYRRMKHTRQPAYHTSTILVYRYELS
jgi:hypothetical protein